MTNTPASIIFIPVPIPVGGSQEPLRRAKPIYPAKRYDQRWPLNQPIPPFTPPADQIEAMLELARRQRSG